MQSKILIVEEQSKTTDRISAQLEENGYLTDICHSTDELFSTFKAGAYVLMILDLELANTDGFWLSEKIRDLDDNIIIFFLIGSIRHSQEIITLFPIWAVSNFFDKPIIADEIIEQVLETIKNDQRALRNFKKWS